MSGVRDRRRFSSRAKRSLDAGDLGAESYFELRGSLEIWSSPMNKISCDSEGLEESRMHKLTCRRMSTDHVAERERFAYWVDLICSQYVRLECDAPVGDVFGHIESRQIGMLALTEVRSNTNHIRRTSSMIRGDLRDDCLVMLQRSGRGRVLQDGREARLSPGDFVLYDTARPYELHFDGSFHEVVVVQLPRIELQQHTANFHDLTATALPGRKPIGKLLLTMIDSMWRDAEGLQASSALGVSEALVSIIAAALRGLQDLSVRRPSNLSVYHINRVRAYVMEHIRDPKLSIASIASAMQLSPEHLSRLFRGEPQPLSRWIWLQRLSACRRDLSDPSFSRHSISQIAFSWGFNDATHFSRLFKNQFGICPRDWRQQCGSLNSMLT